MRLHELSKELEADSKRMLAIAKELGLGVKSHSSNLAKGTEGILRAAWSEELIELAEKAARKAAKAAAAEAAEAGETIAEPEQTGAAAAEEPAAGEATVRFQIRSPGEPAAEPKPAPVEEAQEPVAEQAAASDEDGAVEAPVVADSEEQADGESVAETVAESPVDAPVAESDTVAADEGAPEPVPAEDDGGKHVVVTFGGQPAAADEEPPEEAPVADAEPGVQRPAAMTDNAVRQVGRVNVPDRVERRGAKILGKIDLSKAETEPRGRTGAPAYDPLDPTRAMPPRRDSSTRREGDRSRSGRPGKESSGDFIFDPEDNTALSAIRLGHFAGRRRPPPRRPPPRRSRFGRSRRPQKAVQRPTHPVSVRAPIGVRELSEALGIKAREILMTFPTTFDPRDKNAVLNEEQLLELSVSLEREITILPEESAERNMLERADVRAAELATGVKPRPPVVVVMGHVDHGKTTLLDNLRKSRVAAKEAGGITQHTSAYSVATKSGASVTFLDTPGHKAFTAMRARGAQVTDVAVLVVAADDGVMEQTQEAIDHATAGEIPMVVAINKCDRNNADPMRVRQQLASAGILVEDYGGEVGVIECSATTGDGLDNLLERLALETELLELEADPGVPARGVVIDSTKDAKLGVVCTVVVEQGTLRAKDVIIAGDSVGRVRWLLDDRGKRATEAGPSIPVQVVGFEKPPEPGARFMVVDDISLARDVVAERKESARVLTEPAVDAVTLENLFDTIQAQKVKEINVLLKAGNTGATSVLQQTVEDVCHDEVVFKVIRCAVGAITEDDVLLASASEAFIIGFGVVADVRARAAVARTGVDVKYYEVIYEMTDDLEKAIEGELGTETHEEVIGHATIRAIFKASRLGNIAGCYVTDGIITRDSHVRLVRDGTVVHSGRMDSLKRFKDDAKEVRDGYECGIHLAGYNDIKEDDVLEAFTVTEVKRTLESSASER